MSTLTVQARSGGRRASRRQTRPGRRVPRTAPGAYLRRSGAPIQVRPAEPGRPGAATWPTAWVPGGLPGQGAAPCPRFGPLEGAGLVAAPGGPRAPARRRGRAAVGIAPAAPSSQPTAAAARLTRRGRLLLTVLTAVLVAGLAVLALVARPVTLGGGPVAAAERVTVRPGDTLWSIAERVAPGADPRDTIAGIESLNHLTSSSVQVGVQLQVPAGAERGQHSR